MSVSNGQNANETTFNNAFVSKTSDSTVVSNIDLNDPDLSQGSQVTQLQRELNSLNSFVGKIINAAKDAKPTWNNNDYGSPTDDVKTRADELTFQVASNAADILLKENLSDKGAVNGYCPLDGTGKVDESYLPASILGQLDYKGTWNASTNTPSLSDATGEQGWFYYVTVGGTQDLGSGNITFNSGDSLIHDGSIWEKIDGSQQQFKTEFRTITAGEAAAKQLTLAEVPLFPMEVILMLKGGSVQFYGDDYSVAVNVLSWNALDLDGLLADGDKIIIQYVY